MQRSIATSILAALAAVTVATAAARAQNTAEPAAQPPKAPPQTVPGSTSPAATRTVTAEAKAVAVVPDVERTPLAIKVDDPNLKWAACPALFPEGCRLTVLHGDPAKPGADVYLQVPAGYRIPAHSHTSAERMVLVTGELEVQYQGRSPIVLQTGQYAYGPAGLPHTAFCRSAGPCTLFIAFDTEVDALPYQGKL